MFYSNCLKVNNVTSPIELVSKTIILANSVPPAEEGLNLYSFPKLILPTYEESSVFRADKALE